MGGFVYCVYTTFVRKMQWGWGRNYFKYSNVQNSMYIGRAPNTRATGYGGGIHLRRRTICSYKKKGNFKVALELGKQLDS